MSRGPSANPSPGQVAVFAAAAVVVAAGLSLLPWAGNLAGAGALSQPGPIEAHLDAIGIDLLFGLFAAGVLQAAGILPAALQALSALVGRVRRARPRSGSGSWMDW